MTEKKESSPDSSHGTDSNSSSSESDGASSHLSNQLHLQVPSRSNSASSQSSPRTSTSRGRTSTGGRGSSSSSIFSTGEISYRDLSNIEDEFKIVKILHDGSFSKILLARQDDTGGDGGGSTNVTSKRLLKSSSAHSKFLVLKAIPSGGLFTDDFKRELRYNYFLSPHPNIVTSFNISFNWASSYNVYVQEHAPLGDLSRHVSANSTAQQQPKPSSKCLPECQVKLIASQLASALEFIHSFKLVHQDVRLENVLVFKSNFSRVKLCDFGSTRREGTLISKGALMTSSCSSYLSPELSYLLPQEKFESHRSADVWQMGILLCLCLTGSFPWNEADFADPIFKQYTNWLKRKSLKVPDPFKKFTPRLTRLLKRLFEPKWQLRSEIREIFKYLKDDWMKANNKRIGCSGGGLARGSRRHESRKIAISLTGNEAKIIRIVNSQVNLDRNLKTKIPDLGESSNVVDLKNIDRVKKEEESITKRVEHWILSATAPPPAEKAHGGNCENTNVSETN